MIINNSVNVLKLDMEKWKSAICLVYCLMCWILNCSFCFSMYLTKNTFVKLSTVPAVSCLFCLIAHLTENTAHTGIHGNRSVTDMQYYNNMCINLHKMVLLYWAICWLIVVVHCRCLLETVCQLKCAISVSSRLIHRTILNCSARARTLRCGSISGVWICSQIRIR
jgi:hypothetical protein